MIERSLGIYRLLNWEQHYHTTYPPSLILLYIDLSQSNIRIYLSIMGKHIMLQIIVSFGAVVILGLFLRLYSALVATPRRLRRLLKEQGIGGPPPANFLLGNVLEMKTPPRTPKTLAEHPHNFATELHAVFHKWRRQYGILLLSLVVSFCHFYFLFFILSR